MELGREDYDVVIVGGGLVGLFGALCLGRQGGRHSINSILILEKQKKDAALGDLTADPGLELPPTRNINMALSHRGLQALASIQLDQAARDLSTPLVGRCVHDHAGSSVQLYGTGQRVGYKSLDADKEYGSCLYSIKRSDLLSLFLDQIALVPQIRIYFESMVTSVTIEDSYRSKAILDVSRPCGIERVQARWAIGADGVHSVVRRCILAKASLRDPVTLSCPFCYVELVIRLEDLPLELRYILQEPLLRLWRPRRDAAREWDGGIIDLDSLFIVGLPGRGAELSCVVFCRVTERSRVLPLESIGNVLGFFRVFFPGFLSLWRDEGRLQRQWGSQPRSRIFVTEHGEGHERWMCYRNNCILMGDSVHSMLPFYGQGLNAGLEDVFLFMSRVVLGGEGPDLSELKLEEFAKERQEDAAAICRLSERHCRALVEGCGDKGDLEHTLVSFTSERYTEIQKMGE